jgi:ankyrin repeat protein
LHSIHEGLNPPDPVPNHERCRKLKNPETGKWFLTSDTFAQWKDAPGSFLWLYGIPGCGKTILSPAIIDDIRAQSKYLWTTTITYYYFDVSDKRKQTLQGLICSLLAQILAQNQDSMALLKESFVSEKPPSADSLEKAFDKVISNLPSQDFYIVLDALDECADQRMLLVWLSDLWKKHKSRLHITATSRQEEMITRYLRPYCLEIPIQTHLVDGDIQLYIKDQLDQVPELSDLSDPTKRDISHKLLSKSKGMFRWTVCQIENLKDCMSEADLQDTLYSLPADLQETYTRSLRKIPPRLLAGSCKILLWIIYTGRPLKLEELADILMTNSKSPPDRIFLPNYDTSGELGELIAEIPREEATDLLVDERRRLLRVDDILRYCGTLATTLQSEKNGSKVLILAHASVREYLVQICTRGGYTWLTPQYCHDVISRMCLNYLTHVCGQPDVADGVLLDTIAARYPLIEYAAMHCQYHLKLANAGSNSVVSIDETLKILETKRLLSICKSYWDFYFRKISNPHGILMLQGVSQPMQKACYFGLTSSVEVLIRDGVDVNATTAQLGYLTGLDIACYNNDEMTVRTLLGHGAKSIQLGGGHGDALQIAAWRQNETIVSLLLHSGADANSQGGKHGKALQSAAYNGNEAIVSLLIKYGADVNSEDSEYGTPLQAAVAARVSDNKAIVQTLLDHGANVNPLAKKHGDILYTAVVQGHEDIVRMLLSSGAKINPQCGKHGSILQTAVYYSHRELANLLLDNGISGTKHCNRHGNALTTAISTRNTPMIELLISRVDRIADETPDSVLLKAVRDCNEEEVRLLVKYGVRARHYQTEPEHPLMAAILLGYLEIAKVLIDFGIGPSIQQGYPYFWVKRYIQVAASCRDVPMLELLLDQSSITDDCHPKYGGIIQIAVCEMRTGFIKGNIPETLGKSWRRQ